MAGRVARGALWHRFFERGERIIIFLSHQKERRPHPVRHVEHRRRRRRTSGSAGYITWELWNKRKNCFSAAPAMSVPVRRVIKFNLLRYQTTQVLNKKFPANSLSLSLSTPPHLTCRALTTDRPLTPADSIYYTAIISQKNLMEFFE